MANAQIACAERDRTMAKKEVRTDLWVASQLDECGIQFDAQGSNIKGINEALACASKNGTGNAGYPEYVAVINDFVLVIEDKADTAKHVKLTDDGVLDMSVKAVRDCAVNGAYFYAKAIAQNSEFHKVFAVGVSGDAKHHEISPLYVDDREGYKELPNLESFVSFSAQNIYEYYLRNVLEETTDVEKTTEQILKDAAKLHEYLRTYGTLKDQDKPLVVSGILLALDEIEFGGFSVDSLTGDQTPGMTDGDKLMMAIKGRLTRSNVGPDVKRDKLMSEFAIFKTSESLNEINGVLGMSPLKYYTNFLYERVFKSIKYQRTSEDFIGRFYGEFMSYSGGDGQALGIILTPRHICDLMCEIVDVKPDDVVLDPCCGTAGFLISAMHQMLSKATTDYQKTEIKKRQLHGFELQTNMFAIAATNMILRKDGNSNLECANFLKKNPAQVQLKGATVGLMNPPYSQGTKKDPEQYEISFVEHLLDSLTQGARCAVIVPQSSLTGKTKDEQKFRTSILKRHTLNGVITCNTDTFYGVGTNVAIAVFTAGEPQLKDKRAKFIDFRDDGYEVRAHIGLVEGDSAKDKRQHLLDVWNERVEAPSKFCVESEVSAKDEWLHSFYYFNDEIPSDVDFEKSVSDYLTFEFSMILQNREYLFDKICIPEIENKTMVPLAEKNWADIELETVFTVGAGKRLTNADKVEGTRPFIGATDHSNGVTGFVGNDNASKDSNVLGVNYNGAPCIAFYHPYECVFTDDVKRLHLREHEDNVYVLLFMKTIIMQQRPKYSYGYKFNERRMLRQKLMLPIADSGEPDYAYMEQYSKNLMRRKYEQYLAFLDKQQ
jgi:type I restriction-modification system DNA methylase subunit